ncbi:MAG: carbon-nitrogen hydrolase family protein [Lentisphaerota bacterium]
MSKYVKIASVLFDQEHLRNQSGAREQVLEETIKKLDSLKGYGLNLVVLSEGIEAVAQHLEDAEEPGRPGPLLNIYMDFAISEKCHVAGSVKLLENGRIYNSAAFISPSGKILGVYHKTYLTIGELEKGLAPGTGAVCFDTEIGRLGGIICFDLNFENVRKQYVELKPDIMVFPSMHHGGLTQQIWPYECRSFFVSALPFHGGGILDPYGQPLSLTDCHKSVAMAKVNLDRVMVHLDYNREKFADIEKKYGDEVCIDIPLNIGSALIYSQTEKRTAMDIAREYGLEQLDDYFNRSLDANSKGRMLTGKI